jgi:hypothetical protein
MYTFDKAVPDHVVGRIVGEGGQFIAVTVIPSPGGKGGLLLAVHRNGGEYATFAYGWNMAEDGVNVWNGEYFSATALGGASEAFQAAVINLNARVRA